VAVDLARWGELLHAIELADGHPPYRYRHGWIPVGGSTVQAHRDLGKEFEGRTASGVVHQEPLARQGTQSKTDVLTTRDGSKWVQKEFLQPSQYLSTREMADREEAASLVAHAIGARAVPVIRTGTHRVAMPFVENTGTAKDHGIDDAKLPKDALLGLLDGLIANSDRHADNLLMTGDGPAGIDHSGAWRLPGGKWEIHSSLAREIRAHDFTSRQFDEMDRRLKALRPEFERIFGGLQQYTGTMAAFESIRTRYFPGAPAN
jgi:hypothetical protein